MEKKELISKNIECNWIITNKNNTLKTNGNYYIISVVYFNYKNVDRYKSDKNINDKYLKYYKGLLNIIKNFRKILENFILRIYYDDSVEDEINKLLKETNNEFNEYIELFKYNIPVFKKDGQHIKTFGTLIRFLPLFDYELHKVNKCIILDIDNNLRENFKNIIDFCINNKVKLSYRSRLCYYIHKRIKCISKDFNYGIIASFIYQSISIEKIIFEKFLEDTFITKKNKKLIIDKCRLKDEFEYGIDEIFLNSKYIEYFFNNKINIYPIIFNSNDILSGLTNFFYKDDKILNEDFNTYKDFIVNFLKIFNFEISFVDENDVNSLIKNMVKFSNKINREFTFKIRKKKYNRKELYRFLIHSVKTIKIKDFKLLIDCIFKNLKLNLNKINIHEVDTDTRNVNYHYIDI